MTDTIKRHANGSIDTAYYIARAHRIRSDAAHRALATTADAVPAPEGVIRSLLAGLTRRHGAQIPAE